MNPPPTATANNMTWITYALMTVFFWGVYGVILHAARGYMPDVGPTGSTGPEGAHAGLKAFLLVCGAYCLTGIITLVVLKMRGSTLAISPSGLKWGVAAGLAGALGAFTLVLSLGAAATPIMKGGGGLGVAAAAAVMPIVFGCAPVVNTITAFIKAPPAGGLRSLPLEFVIGIILAASGAFLVAKYAPSNSGAGHGAGKPAPSATPAAPAIAVPSAPASVSPASTLATPVLPGVPAAPAAPAEPKP